MSKNSEQPAYPIFNEWGHATKEGLTKREYYAGITLQGILANSRIVASDSDIVKASISLADELLKQLETK